MVSSWQLLTIVVTVLLLSPTNAWFFSSGGGSSRRTHSFDIGRRSELTRLYNQPVRRVTHVERPIGRLPMVGPIRHSGVVVDTQDGRRFLVHKHLNILANWSDILLRVPMLCELFNFTLLEHCECSIHVSQPDVWRVRCFLDCSFFKVFLAQWRSGAVAQWRSGAVAQWRSGAVAQWLEQGTLGHENPGSNPGPNYGRSSETVVTDAKHMSRNWRTVGSRPVSGSSVGDFVRAGGREYSVTRDNCHDGRCRMMALP
ncbi:hypothetical protein NP493_851g00015 [Ridgeia piscesae]|uniref:Secreted protein n=1 Tax=Ridgeia piscesae TaxID=27915 RepID=A0AAD9KLY5_RIDPI|nr:hypothetical protein NP493_851g00015 [Ridgeia piscesae]